METHQIEPRTYILFMFELDDKCKIFQNSDYRKCSWESLWLDEWNDFSQEHFL